MRDQSPIEKTIGHHLRALRVREGNTIKELATRTGLSQAMLSRIENGAASPSLKTLKTLARVFSVSVASLFQETEKPRDVSYVAAGQGVRLTRQGVDLSHEYRLLGHSPNPNLLVEPFQVVLKSKSDVYSHHQGTGTWFIYIQEGELDFRCGNDLYRLKANDSLMYDAYSPNGPERLIQVPIRYLCVHCDHIRAGNQQRR
jgi:transcriptional regulator with XRE-family HTH domain